MTLTQNRSGALSLCAAGRGEELAALRDAYHSACRGELRLLLVDGPSATGKGALIDAFLAEHRAGPVLRVSGRRGESLAEQLSEAGLGCLSPVRRARHGARASRPRDGVVVDLLAAAEHRLQMREHLRQLLAEVGAANPAIVFIDRLDPSARSAVELLTGLVGEDSPFTDPPKVLFVATLDEAPSGAIAKLGGSNSARTLTLRALDRDGVRSLLSSPDAVDAVLALTGGLPELVERLLGGEGLAAVGETPERDPSVCEALDVLALAGGALEDELLRAIAGAFEAPVFARAGAIQHDDGWVLSPQACDRVSAGLEPARARAIHGQLAEALAELRPAAAARHALVAGRADRAAELALAGAEEFLARHTPVAAADLLLEIVRGHACPSPELRRRLVELLWIAGDHEDALTHARALAAEFEADALLLGRLLGLAGDHVGALATLERARSTVGEEARGLAEAALAEARYQAGDLDGAEILASPVAEEEGSLALVLDAQNTLAKIAMARGDLDGAEERLARVLVDAERGSLSRQASQARINLAITALGRGELQRAERGLERMLELDDDNGAVYFRGLAHKNLAVVKQLDGDWTGALGHAERALSLLSGLGNASLLARLSFNTADLHRSLGDPYRALRLCAYARERGKLDRTVSCEGMRVEAEIHAELGHLEEARRAWSGALENALELGASDAVAGARLGLARLLADAGDRPAAKALVAQVAEASLRVSARRDRLAARLAEGEEDRVSRARFAMNTARKTSDPLLIQDAHLELTRALSACGLETRAAEELALIRERERDLTPRVPEALRPLFAERPLVRGIAALERELRGGVEPVSKGPSTRADARAMIGQSPGMLELRSWIERVGATESSVLVTGESGSGKELVAEALHRASSRASAPLVRVNCAALVDTLLSSELFGHERGAFTGADRQKKGRFELAAGGTIFLDEIGDISPRMQAALLRILQERTFERVGGTRTMHVDVRVIAATHRDLEALVREGIFREDLYYRLSGIKIRVPALRERLTDLPALASHLLAKIAQESDAPQKVLAPDALDRLAVHSWPGNVRELENALRGVAVLTSGSLLTAADFEALAPRVSSPSPPPAAAGASLGALAYERLRGGDGSIYELRKRLERECIERALSESGGNISRAAETLGMKRPRLSKLVNEWGLK